MKSRYKYYIDFGNGNDMFLFHSNKLDFINILEKAGDNNFYLFYDNKGNENLVNINFVARICFHGESPK